MSPNNETATFWDAFQNVADAQPDELAMVEGPSELSYARLRADVESLAAILIHRLGPGDHHVGIRAKSARTLLTASLGIARASMVSVSLDMRDPLPRVGAVCKDADVHLIVTDIPGAPEGTEVVMVGPEGLPAGTLAWRPEAQPDDLSCITYSSGSTGMPKGIMWSHRTRIAMRDLASGTMVTGQRQGVPFAGTAGNSDMFSVSTLMGKTLVVYPIGENGLTGLTEWVKSNDIGSMGMVPTLVRHLLATLAPGELLPLRQILMYGEGSMWSDVDRLRQHLPADAVIQNTYGAMETAGGTSFSVTSSTPIGDGKLPAGWPSPGREVEVVGDDGVELPCGETGEIRITGENLPSGYWGKPELTAEKWWDVGQGRRQYRTGDLGYKMEDGCLVVVGRNDHMVKVNGFKVELTAIERALLSVPGVGSAAATTREDQDGNLRVVAWVVAGGGHSERSLRAELCRLLPGFMVPDRVILIDELPRLSNGKTDRQELGRREVPEAANNRAGDDMASQIARLFDRVLVRKGTGPDDDFFELGGDSLRAARLVAELEKAFGIFPGVAITLEARTPAALAAFLSPRLVASSSGRPDAPSQFIPLRVTGNRAPLIVVHDGTGGVMYARGLADLLGDDQPVYAIEGQQTGGHRAVDRTIEAMAARYVGDITRALPSGPVAIFGYSFGGILAFEMAQQLRSAGREVALVAIGDSPIGAGFVRWEPPPAGNRLSEMLKKAPNYGVRAGAQRAASVARGFAERKKIEYKNKKAAPYLASGKVAPHDIRGEVALADSGSIAATYEAKPYDGDVLLFTTTPGEHARPENWRELVQGELIVANIDSTHMDMMKAGNIDQVAKGLDHAIQEQMVKDHSREPVASS